MVTVDARDRGRSAARGAVGAGHTRRALLASVTGTAGAGGALLLAACGGQADQSGGAGAPSGAAGTVRFSFWLSAATPQAIERVMQKGKPFAAQFPKAVVEPVAVPGNYAERIVTETAGGSASDAIMVDAYYAQEWYGNGMAVPLDARMGKTRLAVTISWAFALTAAATTCRSPGWLGMLSTRHSCPATAASGNA
jgi:ABC-type glycerol-3-phosphate transport system substrate-binding protein